MAIDVDLVGLGMPPAMAKRVGFPPAGTVNAAGTAVGTATVLKLAQRFVLVNADVSQTGVRLSADTELLAPVVIYNNSAQGAVIYPPAGHTLNGTTLQNVASAKTAIFWRYSSTAWISILTA